MIKFGNIEFIIHEEDAINSPLIGTCANCFYEAPLWICDHGQKLCAGCVEVCGRDGSTEEAKGVS